MLVYVPSPDVVAIDPADGSVSKNDRASSAHTLRIAAFGCKGLDELSRTLGFPVAVVAAVPDLGSTGGGRGRRPRGQRRRARRARLGAQDLLRREWACGRAGAHAAWPDLSDRRRQDDEQSRIWILPQFPAARRYERVRVRSTDHPGPPRHVRVGANTPRRSPLALLRSAVRLVHRSHPNERASRDRASRRPGRCRRGIP